ncbi:NAD-dependent epimerase/dehydratase [Fibrisoma limi BUZ 3]|uniref:NAD-dependent epimerase/dehydratase n=1 Tax=Fibrisoma limi BUZ 3 TaxID=1185876 RepID=I2GKE8_9BACT|nr:NAD(P)H-binding protein [Fibrisoma limi]CCH54373.1 NAD-dependent epimerase/dehydratase [Fibrisoma limi BUZ 3]
MNTQPTILVLGATGSIGYAVTENLLARQLPVTILVRNRAKAEALFLNQPTLTVVEGDVQDAELLKRVAADKDFIFHGINYPYNQWFGNMDTATQKVIDAASQRGGAVIVFPGNIYGFGKATEPIREDSPVNPIARKGQLRVEIEAMLEKAAKAGHCRVLNVRLPDFWGPNVLNDGVRPIFENALQGKALPWLYTIDIPHQAVYTKDAAEVIVRLMLRSVGAGNASDAGKLSGIASDAGVLGYSSDGTSDAGSTPAYQVFNYGGQVHPSMRSFFSQIAELTGKPLKTQVYSPLFVSVMGLFLPILREVKEMGYLYQNTVVLDDTKVRSLFPDFQETPLKQALAETLTWFANHQLKIEFTPSAGALNPSRNSSANAQPETRQGLIRSIS